MLFGKLLLELCNKLAESAHARSILLLVDQLELFIADADALVFESANSTKCLDHAPAIDERASNDHQYAFAISTIVYASRSVLVVDKQSRVVAAGSLAQLG